MKPVLLSFDKNEYDARMRFANQDLAEYDKIIAALQTNAPEIDLSSEVIQGLWGEPSEYVFDILTKGKDLTFLGLKVSKKKALEFVELNDGHNALIDVVNQLKEEFSNKPAHKYQHNSSINRLSLDDVEFSKGKLILTTEFIENCNRQCSVYTETELENHVFEGIVTLRNTLDNVLALGLGSVYNINGLEALGITGINNGKVDFNPLAIKQLMREYERSHRPHVKTEQIKIESKSWHLKS